MGRFAVIREAGPGWDSLRSLREQQAWPEHAAFMNALVDEGFVVVGGPVGGGPKTLLMVEAESEAAIRRRLDQDPWAPLGLLTVESIEPGRSSLERRETPGKPRLAAEFRPAGTRLIECHANHS